MTSLLITPLKSLITRLLQATLSKYFKNIHLEGVLLYTYPGNAY